MYTFNYIRVFVDDDDDDDDDDVCVCVCVCVCRFCTKLNTFVTVSPFCVLKLST